MLAVLLIASVAGQAFPAPVTAVDAERAFAADNREPALARPAL